MDYYIQGDAANADKIRATFESKGIRVPYFRSCMDSSLIYFSLNKEVLAVTIKALELFQDNPDYTELPLPVEPKFKDGDKVVFGTLHETIAVVLRNEQRYLCESCREILFKEQDRWHLAPKPHYGISNFHAGMPVLVRDEDCGEWKYVLFSHYRKNIHPFCAGGQLWFQCIPFEGNEHLLGTTDMCPKEYINW